MTLSKIVTSIFIASTITISQAHAQEWTGFYAGINAGYGAGNAVSSSRTDYVNQSLSGGSVFAAGVDGALAQKSDMMGFVGGLQLGSNWQSGSLVLGLEADIQGASVDIHTTETNIVGAGTLTQGMRQSLDFLGTARARIGMLLTPSLLAYGTGGLAYGQTTTAITGSHASSAIPSWSADRSSWQFGWTAGGGFELKLSQDISIKGEYLYFDLGAATTSVGILGAYGAQLFTSHTLRSRFDGHLARIGWNVKLN